MQQLTGESLQNHTATGNKVRYDICAQGFWEVGQGAFFDVRILNPNASRYAILELLKSYEINEKERKKYYNELIMQTQHGCFIPVVMSATSGMDRECRKFYVRLSELISEKHGLDWNWIGMLYFVLTKSYKKNQINKCIMQVLAHINRYVQLKSTSKVIMIVIMVTTIQIKYISK